MTESNGRLMAEPPIEYEREPSPSGQLEKALVILEDVNNPKYNQQIKEAMQLIASAKGWYDSTVLREKPC